MSFRGIFAGALALIALQTLVGSNEAAGRFGAMLSSIGDLARAAIDPAVPAIPDLTAAVEDDDNADARDDEWDLFPRASSVRNNNTGAGAAAAGLNVGAASRLRPRPPLQPV